MARKRVKPDYKKMYDRLRQAVSAFEHANGVSLSDPGEWTDDERLMLQIMQAGKTIHIARRLLRGMENTADEIAGHALAIAHAADEVKSRAKTTRTRLRVLAAKKK
jgi:hypothetical protein